MNERPFIVVGGGQAGLQICDALRKLGHAGELVMLAAEPMLPYQRPPLSKKYLGGELESARLLLRPASHYEKLGVDVRLGVALTAIDRARQEILCSDGSRLGYARLALATGARVRRLDCAGAAHAAVHYVRTLADSDGLRAALTAAARVVIVGGGFIGLEVAAIARQMGKEVVLLEALDRLMARAVSAEIADYYAGLHRAHGVELRFSTGVEAIEDASDGVRVLTTGGDRLPADLVIVGIGVLANDEIAAAAGLECRGGIVVDAYARTSDPLIVAAGDCTMHMNGYLEREIRLESVQNAVDQARVAASAMVERPERYVQVPWFWSDQYDVKLQMAGIGIPCDTSVVRGDPATGSFSLFYFREGRFCGADSVNRPADHMASRRLLAQGAMITPAEVADEGFDLMQRARE